MQTLSDFIYTLNPKLLDEALDHYFHRCISDFQFTNEHLQFPLVKSWNLSNICFSHLLLYRPKGVAPQSLGHHSAYPPFEHWTLSKTHLFLVVDGRWFPNNEKAYVNEPPQVTTQIAHFQGFEEKTSQFQLIS